MDKACSNCETTNAKAKNVVVRKPKGKNYMVNLGVKEGKTKWI
jgi:hypothetical protein